VGKTTPSFRYLQLQILFRSMCKMWGGGPAHIHVGNPLSQGSLLLPSSSKGQSLFHLLSLGPTELLSLLESRLPQGLLPNKAACTRQALLPKGLH
jgi:hypothetical protein